MNAYDTTSANSTRRVDDYSGKTILVVGAARSGLAAAEFLLERDAKVILTDLKSERAIGSALLPLKDRARSRGELILEMGGHNLRSFRTSDLVVVSPGVPLRSPMFEESRSRGIPVLAEVELAYRHLEGKILGITGSNGKTTTTALVAELLRGAGLRGHAAGNIGIPLIRFAGASGPEDLYAAELSSFQLEAIRDLRPAVAAILNVTPNHLDRYESYEDYVAAKQRIYMNQKPQDTLVLNADNPDTSRMASGIPSTPVHFSRMREVRYGSFLKGDWIVYRDLLGERRLLPVDAVQLKGTHNLENVLASCTIALLAGASPERFESVVRAFRGVEHRLEWVADIEGVQYFNDSKATSVDATVKAIESFRQGLHLILGGRDKGGDFTALRPRIRERVKSLILLGEAAGLIREALSGSAEMVDAGSLEDAVEIARRRARAGDVVLLAPACASFDMFENYEHRGRAFKAAVHNLKSRDSEP